MKSRPASSASFASARQSSQLADQRSGTVVADRPDEQLAPNKPILSALPLYMATRDCMDALGASTAISSTISDFRRRYSIASARGATVSGRVRTKLLDRGFDERLVDNLVELHVALYQALLPIKLQIV